MIKPEDVPVEVPIAFILTLARRGIPPDVQGLLLNGDEKGTVAPGALYAAIRAALNAWPRAEKSRDEDHPCLILPLERKE